MQSRGLKRVACALLMLSIMMAMFAPGASASISAKVNSSSARAYRSASTSGKSIKVPANLKLTITAISGSWAKVSYKGKTAYMKLSSLAPTKKATGYVTKSATVYNSSGKKVDTVSKGTALYVVGTVNNHYCVMNKSGDVGFMKTGTLSDKKPTSKPNKPALSNVHQNVSPSLKGVEKAIAIAQSYLGTRYSLSGSAPEVFNCSSLVGYCMGKAGYPMNSTAASQAADGRYAKITSFSKMRRGDLLYFDTNDDGRIDHTGIYLGGNSFIEASQKAGKVQYNTLSSWYRSHLKWARRPA